MHDPQRSGLSEDETMNKENPHGNTENQSGSSDSMAQEGLGLIGESGAGSLNELHLGITPRSRLERGGGCGLVWQIDAPSSGR